MKVIKNINIDNTPVYLIGDLHTNYKQFKEQFQNDESLRDCIFIFLGDMDFRDEETAYNSLRNLINNLRNVILSLT